MEFRPSLSITAAALRLLLAGCAFAWFAGPARAELPPQVYREQQRAAPESLEIRVRSVKSSRTKKADHTLITHNVDADVQKVARTATGLKPGATITIRYTQRVPDQPLPGPSEVPTLKKAQVCPAFLARMKKENTYAPAAGGYSFQTVNGR